MAEITNIVLDGNRFGVFTTLLYTNDLLTQGVKT